MRDLSLLHLMHSVSPALPIGAFAYSQGLEYALDAGWCKNAADVEQWLETLLRSGIGTLDLPLLKRLQLAWQAHDMDALQYWNTVLLAYRETRELYEEDLQVGAAFRQWHRHQHPEHTVQVEALAQPTVAAMFALNAVLHDIDIPTSLLGFAWSWLENQIAAATKAMPMGQSEGQRILQRLLPVLAEVAENAMTLNDADMGSSCFGQAMASALHEQQYSRLFRS